MKFTLRNALILSLCALLGVYFFSLLFIPRINHEAASVTPAAPGAIATQDALHGEAADRVSVVVPSPPIEIVRSTVTIGGVVEVGVKGHERRLVKQGTIRFRLVEDEEVRLENSHIELQEGRWSTEVPLGSTLVPLVFVSPSGRIGVPLENALTATEKPSEHVLLVDWESGITLRAIDAQSRSDAHELEVRLVPEGQVESSFGGPPPMYGSGASSEDQFIAGDSPIDLPCFEIPMIGWVRNRNSPWRIIGFSGCDGERTIYLLNGCSLDVSVSDAGSLPTAAYLSVWSHDQVPPVLVERHAVAGRGVVHFEGIPEGLISVLLSSSETERCGQVLDARHLLCRPLFANTIALCAGCAETKLRVASLFATLVGLGDKVESVRVSSLDPDALPFAPLTVRFHGQATKERAVLALGTFAPGAYRVDVAPAISSAVTNLIAGESHDVVLDSDARREVKVFVIDGDTDQLLPSASAYVRLGWYPRGVWTQLAFDDSLGCHTGRIGFGDIQVLANLESHGNSIMNIGDAQVADSVIITLRPVTSFVVRVFVEDSGSGIVVPPEAWSAAKLSPVEPCDGRVLRITFNRAGEGRNVRNYVEWQVDRVGQYEITFPRFAGYDVLENMIVDVSSSSVPPIVVQLQAVPPRTPK